MRSNFGDGSARDRERAKVLALAAQRGLAGAANDTKWNELIALMRQRQDWWPSYRYKSIAGYISGWDVEWWAHLPVPFSGVEWLDIGMHELVHRGALLEPAVIDHSSWILGGIRTIGLEHEVAGDVVRIFGYLPRNYDDFPPAG